MPNYTDTWIIIWIITNYIKNSIISVCYGGLMSMFSSMLGSEESLFRDPIPLDYDYMPKLVPYREKQQQQIALCIKPLLAERNGRNILIHGAPGIGKTVATRHILKELGEETEQVVPIYINCWQKNTTFKIIMEICEQLDYKFTHNKKSDELFNILRDILNKKAAVIVLDEVDKMEDVDFIYMALEEIYRKSLILITNHKEWLLDLDSRIKSRLTAELLEFMPYSKEETSGILQERLKYAFVPDVWENNAFEKAAAKSYELRDIRTGLYLLKEAGNAAEDKASRKINMDHVEAAIKKFDEFYIKKKDSLEDESKFILQLVKKNSGKKIGDLFKEYVKEGGAGGYKTFQRKISSLAENKYISVKKIGGGTGGNTTIVTHFGSVTTLDAFDKKKEQKSE